MKIKIFDNILIPSHHIESVSIALDFNLFDFKRTLFKKYLNTVECKTGYLFYNL